MNTLIRYVKGSDFLVTFIVQDSTGQPFNLTGYTATLTVKPTETSTSASFTVAGTIAVPTNGVIVFALLPASAASLTPGQYRYDVKIVQSSPAKTYYVQSSAAFELLYAL